MSFDDATVAEVIQVFNERSTETVLLADAPTAQRRVGGVFSVDHPERFAEVLQQLLHIHVRYDGHTIRLEGRQHPE